jgi:hypothetical protein
MSVRMRRATAAIGAAVEQPLLVVLREVMLK